MAYEKMVHVNSMAMAENRSGRHFEAISRMKGLRASATPFFRIIPQFGA